jgi:hypothetical protein
MARQNHFNGDFLMSGKPVSALLRATCILACVSFVPAFALAQTSPTDPAQSPGLAAPAPGATAGPVRPLAMAKPDQMLGADLRGARVYGANNENVGDIRDILLERDGRVAAFIVGVGGFLGIGEKSVALPFNAFEFAPAGSVASATSGAARDPATTGSTPSRSSAGSMKPERIILRNMTKVDLEAAPAFGLPM